jgi:hypothetical protein
LVTEFAHGVTGPTSERTVRADRPALGRIVVRVAL